LRDLSGAAERINVRASDERLDLGVDDGCNLPPLCCLEQPQRSQKTHTWTLLCWPP
jgi:hypothetical protein